MSFAYQVGPGMSRILSLAPPYAFAKSGENTVTGDTDLFAISGSSRLAMRVQWMSAELMRTVFGATTCEIGQRSGHR